MDELFEFISQQSEDKVLVPTVEAKLPEPSRISVETKDKASLHFDAKCTSICFGTITGHYHRDDIYEIEVDLLEGYRVEARASALDSTYPLVCGDQCKVFYLQNDVDDEDENDDETVSNPISCIPLHK